MTSNEERIAAAIHDLAVMTSPRFPIAEDVKQAYATRLQRDDPATVERAVEHLASTEESFPSMALLLRTIDNLRLHRKPDTPAPGIGLRTDEEREAIREASRARMAQLDTLFDQARNQGWSEERLKREMAVSRTR